MRILILGAYGLIGSHVTRTLCKAGHDIIGLGRNTAAAARRFPEVQWVMADLTRLNSAEAWTPILDNAKPDVVVNCAGVLQDGLADDVARVQSGAMRALFAAAEQHGIRTFVQVSAPRASADADTVFMRTKGEADAALQSSSLDWIILRPGLVLAPEAYGGSALLRALAAFPTIQPLTHADALIQTVAVSDVAGAIGKAVSGGIPSRQVYDLVEPEPHKLADIVAKMRAWLGFPAARLLAVPPAIAKAAAAVADGLSWLGWRSPLRTAAIAEIEAGVTGNPEAWTAQAGQRLKTLDETLADLPATAQERWFARAFLLKPVVIGTLSLFWLATGLIALVSNSAAIEILAQRGIGDTVAAAIVIGGAIADIALGLLILFRKTARAAALGMIALTLGYLAGGTLVAPDLWLDPLGALVKPIPAMILALIAAAMMDER